MEHQEQKHIVIMSACDAELTADNIDAICARVRNALVEQRENGAEMLSGLVLVGNDKSAPSDVADTLGGIAEDAYANARGDDYNDSDKLAFSVFKTWLVVGLRDTVFKKEQGA